MHNMAIHTIVSTVWYGGLIILSGVLTREYLFFRAQADQLSRLRTEYTEYIAALKHYNKVQSATTLTTSSAISTLNNNRLLKPTEYKYIVVNREPAYLRQSALSFARKHRLEHAVKKLYQDSQALQQEVTGRSKTSRTRTSAQNLLYLAEYKKLCRQALFICPLEESRFWLSSSFGPRKNTDGTWGFHRGIDLAAPRGTPVRAARSGKVIKAHYSASYGNTIVIEHYDNFKTRYAHLDSIAVRFGQQVTQGMCIGKVGATGTVRKSKHSGDASHLHFEIYHKGKQINPFFYLSLS
jgi:murein DD-endopeptidase MepM/ murein hydrolase activator NlpD